MLNLAEHDIVRKTLLDFNLADHYVDAVMTEIERRLQLEEIKQSLTTGLQSIIDNNIEGFKDEPGPTGVPGPIGVQYSHGPRPQPYNHDRSQL